MPAPPALFDSLIDYAGLFPPAGLAMADVVRNHAAYLAGPQAARLGRFILPLTRLPEFEAAYAALPAAGQAGWRLSVLAGNSAAADARIIEDFNRRQPAARIVSVETKAGAPADVAPLTCDYPSDLEVWVEISPHGETIPFIAAIKAANRHAKIRTGGVTAGAIPPATHVAGFLAACRDAGVVCKATAGLHHPWRGNYRLTYEPDSPQGTLFGFLNVFLSAVLLHTGGGMNEAVRLLTESDGENFAVSSAAIGWRQYSFSSSQISATRQSLCRSFGSCSFTEPIEGLQQLRWL